MDKVTDVKAYWAQTLAKGGLSDETRQQLLGLLDDPMTAKALTESFVPTPNYHSNLDAVKAKTAKDTEAAWLEANKEVIDRANKVLAAAKGDDPNPGQQPTGGLTTEQIEKLVTERAERLLAGRDANYMVYAEIRDDYREKFGKSLNRTEFENWVKENGQTIGPNATLDRAYEKYIAPEVEKRQAADFEAKLKAAREEGVREGFSKRSVPTDSGPREFSPIFDQNRDVLKMDPQEREAHAREAFISSYKTTA